MNIESSLFIWQFISLIILTLAIILPIWALIDILKGRFEDANAQIIWVFIVIFMPLVGSLLYFKMSKGQKRKRVFNPFEKSTTGIR